MSLLLKQVEAMDVKSDEFWNLFQIVNDKYFTIKDPDQFQSAAIVLNDVLHRGEEWMVIVCAKIAMGLFDVVEKNSPAAHGSFDLDQGMYFFDIYGDKDALGSVHKMFRNIVSMKAKGN